MNREPSDPFFDIVENQGFNPIDSKKLRTAFQDPVITGLLEEASLANEILRESGGGRRGGIARKRARRKLQINYWQCHQGFRSGSCSRYRRFCGRYGGVFV